MVKKEERVNPQMDNKKNPRKRRRSITNKRLSKPHPPKIKKNN